MRFATLFTIGLLALTGCSGGDKGGGSTSTSASGDTNGCANGSALAGATYDLSKSRFAFGSAPVETKNGNLDRFVGSDGVVAITTLGDAQGIMNAGAPESQLPDWSTDGAALTAHVSAYFASMGVDACQIARTNIFGSAGGGGASDGSSTTVAPSHQAVVFTRGIEGILVAESNASAQVNNADQSVSESLFWPTIPADVVTAAKGFQSALAAPGALTAFKAKLRSDAQGDGAIVIHHSSGISQSGSIEAVATYDVQQVNSFGDGASLSFDSGGSPVTLPQ